MCEKMLSALPINPIIKVPSSSASQIIKECWFLDMLLYESNQLLLTFLSRKARVSTPPPSVPLHKRPVEATLRNRVNVSEGFHYQIVCKFTQLPCWTQQHDQPLIRS